MGRVTIFSLKECIFCSRAKDLLMKKGVTYYEISLTDYPEKRDDMLTLAGRLTLPQIFFDEEHVGGCDALYELESKHSLDDMLRKLEKTPDCTNPLLQRPNYAPKSDSKSGEEKDPDPNDLLCIGAECQLRENVAADLRENLEIKDRMYRFKTYKTCFLGSDLVDYLTKKYHKSRADAVLLGEQLRVENVFDHVTHEHQFEDSGSFYRLAGDWHPLVLNTNRVWTQPVEDPHAAVKKAKQALSAIVADHTDSHDGLVDYEMVIADKRFPHFENLTCEFQQVDMSKMTLTFKKAFVINIYNLLTLHAFCRVGVPKTNTQRAGFFDSLSYDIGGDFYSLNDIESGILRANSTVPYRFSPQFRLGDRRLVHSMAAIDYRIHAALNCGAKSCPPIKQFTPENVDNELRIVLMAFLEDPGNFSVDLTKRTITCTKILHWYRNDFAPDNYQLIMVLLPYTSGATKERLEALIKTKDFRVSHFNYDWTTNAKPSNRGSSTDICSIS